MATPQDPLSAESLAILIASLLLKSSLARPHLKNATDAIAIACHAGMLAVGFRLVGLGEDHTVTVEDSTPPSATGEARTETTTTTPSASPAALPAEWNASSSPAFRYRHSQSSMEFVLKVSRLGGRTVVNAIAVEDSKPVDFHLTTSDYVSASALPFSLDAAESGPTTADTKRAIMNIFISPSRLGDLGKDLRVNVIQRLLPSLQKEGYEDTREATSSSTSTGQGRTGGRTEVDPAPEMHGPRHDPLRRDPDEPARPRPLNPLADTSPMPGPRRPIPDFAPPGFEDEHEMQRPWMRNPLGGGGGLGMPGYGDRDLYPPGLGPHDPLRIGGPRRGGGGMHPTFDDPMFGRRPGQGDDGFYNPQAPPGARYDPTGPGDGRPFGSGGGGRPPNPFGGFGRGDFI